MSESLKSYLANRLTYGHTRTIIFLDRGIKGVRLRSAQPVRNETFVLAKLPNDCVYNLILRVV